MQLKTGVIFNIQRFSVNDGPGIRTTIFFKGCPLSCIWCQNPESRICEPENLVNTGERDNPTLESFDFYFENNNGSIGKRVTSDFLLNIILKDYMFYEESNGGVTFSGGEPMNHADFLCYILKACKEKDIHTAIDTSGYAAFEQFEKILLNTDLFLYDLKIIDDEDHIKYTGVSNKLILENLIKLSGNAKNIILRIPLIPGITDTDNNTDEIIRFIKGLNKIKQVSLLPFNEMSKSKYKKINLEYELEHLQTQAEDRLMELENKFTANGFEVKIRG